MSVEKAAALRTVEVAEAAKLQRKCVWHAIPSEPWRAQLQLE